MIADPVPPVSRPRMPRSTLATFAFVLCAHAVIAWWLLGAKFGHEPVLPEEPLFVMVVADGVDDPGGAAPGPAGAASDHADHAPAAPAEPQGEPSPPARPTSEPLPDPAPAQASAEPVAIAVDKSVQKPVNNSVDKADRAPVAQAPRAAPPLRKESRHAPDAPAKLPAQQAPDPSLTMGNVDANSVGGAQASAVASAAGNAAASAQGSGAGGVGAASGPRHIVRPDYLDGPPIPSYPQGARSRRQQGKVIVRVVISPAGLPSAIDVLQTSGFDALDRAAIDAVRRARFRPYAENGVALEALVDIPFEFVLRN